MTRRQQWGVALAGALTATGLAAIAVIWGSRGVETVSWLAGIASAVTAVATLVLLRPARNAAAPAPSVANQTAVADRGGRTYQAGGDIGDISG